MQIEEYARDLVDQMNEDDIAKIRQNGNADQWRDGIGNFEDVEDVDSLLEAVERIILAEALVEALGAKMKQNRREATLELAIGRDSQQQPDTRKLALERAEKALAEWLDSFNTAAALGLEFHELELKNTITLKVALGRREQRRLGVFFG